MRILILQGSHGKSWNGEPSHAHASARRHGSRRPLEGRIDQQYLDVADERTQRVAYHAGHVQAASGRRSGGLEGAERHTEENRRDGEEAARPSGWR